MKYKHRQIEELIKYNIKRDKSILLLGSRQTGKTTLLNNINCDLSISFILPSVRIRYEKDISLLKGEIEALRTVDKKPLVILDEVQKIPESLDVVQYLIDNDVANFILTGSSVRKLRRGSNINLLPGRVVKIRLDPFIYSENKINNIQEALLYGSLPGIALTKKTDDKEIDLESYVEIYLEEEIRAEALVRNIGSFARFLELAGLESGKIVNFNNISREVGASHTTISSYYEILEDCMIVERVEPISKSETRKKLTKSCKYLFFDLGVRRISANEGLKLTKERLGQLFEEYVGLELIRLARFCKDKTKIKFWRDPDGPEVDWVIEISGEYIPVEVKWSDSPNIKHAKNIHTFLKEYKNTNNKGYIVCRTDKPVKLSESITAIPWQDLSTLV